MIMTLEEFRSKKNKSKPHKYGAVRSESKDGSKFSSKLEKMYYDRLVEAQKSGEISYFLCQVPFKLPGNVKYVCDFMFVKTSYHAAHHIETVEVEYVDVKGKMLPMAILKIKQVEALYPIKIKIVDAKYLTQNNL